MKTVKLGIIGMGRIGKIHYDNIRNHIPQAEVVMISDPQLGPNSKNDVRTVSPDVLIQHPEIDAVIICSPTTTHADYIEQCANSGKHIFCEKPHDLSLSRVIETINLVKQAGVKLMLGFNRRFDPNFQKIGDLVRNGEIGTPQLLKITSRDPEPPSLEYLLTSGGMFLDMSIHDFDMARYIMGKEIKEVYAAAAVLTTDAIRQAGDIDTALVTLKFEDGSMAIIDNSRKAVYGYDQRIEIFGSKGMAKIGNNKPDTHVLYNSEGSHGSLPLHFFLERYKTSYLNEMRIFVDALINQEDMPVTEIDGLKAMTIALAANLSVRENRPVNPEDIMAIHNIETIA